MKTFTTLCCLAALVLLGVAATDQPHLDPLAGKVGSSCTFEGKKLWGKVQVVRSFPDFKVKVVTSFPDLKVKKVTSFPDKCGKWKFVSSFPDFKVKFVTSFPDFSIKYVTSFPGVR
jgi:hypothetical protein